MLGSVFSVCKDCVDINLDFNDHMDHIFYLTQTSGHTDTVQSQLDTPVFAREDVDSGSALGSPPPSSPL